MTVEVEDKVRLSNSSKTIKNIIYPNNSIHSWEDTFQPRSVPTEHTALYRRLITVGEVKNDVFRVKEFPFIKIHVDDVNMIKKYKSIPVPKDTPEWMIETLKGRDDWLPRGNMSSSYGFCSETEHTTFNKYAYRWADLLETGMYGRSLLTAFQSASTCFGGLSHRALALWRKETKYKFVIIKYWKNLNLKLKGGEGAKSELSEGQHIKYLTHLIDMGLMPEHNDPAEVYKRGWWSADLSETSRNQLHLYCASARNVNEFPGIVHAFLRMLEYDLDPYIAFTLAYYMQPQYGEGHGLLRLTLPERFPRGPRRNSYHNAQEVRYVNHEYNHRILREGVVNVAIQQAYQLCAFISHTAEYGTPMQELTRRVSPNVQNLMETITIPKDLYDTEDVTLNIKEIINV